MKWILSKKSSIYKSTSVYKSGEITISEPFEEDDDLASEMEAKEQPDTEPAIVLEMEKRLEYFYLLTSKWVESMWLPLVIFFIHYHAQASQGQRYQVQEMSRATQPSVQND